MPWGETAISSGPDTTTQPQFSHMQNGKAAVPTSGGRRWFVTMKFRDNCSQGLRLACGSPCFPVNHH